MDKKLKEELEGSFPIDGDITPFSRQKIKSVTSDKWNRLSLTELFSQLETLQNRYYLASSAGLDPSILNQLNLGILELQTKISQIQQDGDIHLI